MTLYLVRRHDGTFVQYGFNWTSSMQDAEVYQSIGPARSRVTRWSRMHPKEPLCTILAFTFEEADAVVLDQTTRTKELNAAKRKRDNERRQAERERKRRYLTEEQDRITRELAALKRSS